MSELRIAGRNILSRPILSSISVAMVALGMAVAIVVSLLVQALDRIDQGKNILTLISYITLVIATLTFVMVNYAVVRQRRRESAILRTLGASGGFVFRVVLSESLLIGGSGTLLGVILGHGGAWLIADQLQGAGALPLEPGLVNAEFSVGGAMLALTLIAGLAPAIQLYRQNVVTNLTSRDMD